MFLKKFSAMAIAGLVAFSGVTASADTGFYAKLGGSFLMPSKKLSTNVENSENDFERNFTNKAKKGFGFDTAIGYKIQNNVRTELALSFAKTKFKSHKSDDDNITLETSSPKIRSTALLANAYYDFDLHENFKPYVMAGIGFSHNKLSSFTMEFSGDLTGHVYASASKTDFAFNVGTGAQFPFNESVSLDLGIKYYDHGKFKISDKNISSKYKLRGVAITTGVAISL